MTQESTLARPSRRNKADRFPEPADANAKRGPLTADQQRLAMRYLPMARALARPLKENWPMERHEFESAACLALVEAAQSYDPERNVKFATFARYRIWGALRDVQRGLVTAGWRNDMENAPGFVSMGINNAEERGSVLLAESDRPIGEDLDLAEQVESWLRKIPPRHAAACRALYLEQKTQGEAAELIGVSKSRVSYLHKEAIEMLNDLWKWKTDCEAHRKS